MKIMTNFYYELYDLVFKKEAYHCFPTKETGEVIFIIHNKELLAIFVKAAMLYLNLSSIDDNHNICELFLKAIKNESKLNT